MKLLAWNLSRNDHLDWSYDPGYPAARFWNDWNGPAAEDWCRTEVDRDGNPYTVKWWSLSYQSRGAGRATITSFLVADGIHPPTGAGPQRNLAA